MGTAPYLAPVRPNAPIIFGRAIIRRLIRKASELTAIPEEEIVGKGKVRDVAWTRFAIFVVAREHGKSLWQIGAAFGHMDHTSVKHGLTRAVVIAEQEPDFAELIRLLRLEARREAV